MSAFLEMMLQVPTCFGHRHRIVTKTLRRLGQERSQRLGALPPARERSPCICLRPFGRSARAPGSCIVDSAFWAKERERARETVKGRERERERDRERERERKRERERQRKKHETNGER